MPHLIGLIFDSQSEEKVYDCYRGLKSIGRGHALDFNIVPHFTTEAYGDLDETDALAKLEKFAATQKQMPLSLPSIAMFARSKCLYLAPVLHKELLDCYLGLHDLFEKYDKKGYEYHTPANWTPHVYLDECETEEVARASFDYMLKNYQVIEGTIRGVSLVRIAVGQPNFTVRDFDFQPR